MKCIISIIISVMLITSLNQLFAQDTALLGDDFNISIEGEVNTFARAKFQTQTDTYINGSYISLSSVFKNKVRAVITTKLQEIFKNSELSLNQQFQLGEFIQEAYVEIRDIAGKPIALVVGKQPIPFGQRVQAMPLFRDNPMDDLQKINEVYGFTVDFKEGLFALFDQVEISAFESAAGDLKIGNLDGVSVRLSKMLTDQWMLSASHAKLGRSNTNDIIETKTSIGLIGETTDGYLVGWAEAIFFSNNPRYQNSNHSFTTGGMIRINDSSDIVIEYTTIKNEVREVGLGLTTNFTQNISAGTEVRWIDHLDTDQQELTLGVSMSYAFGPHRLQATKEEYLFNGDE